MYDNGKRDGFERYRLIRCIGRGGEGSVYLALDMVTEKRVAVKKQKNELTAEAELLRSLKHPGIPEFIDYYEEPPFSYLVMEYIDGRTLKSVIEEGGLSEESVRSIAKSLLGILAYLHSLSPPIIFLDIKPSNIMLSRDGRVYLIDFGIAERKTGRGIRPPDSHLTRGYAAPEQYLKRYRLDERTDLYSLGVTLHYLLTGKNPNEPPYTFESVKVLNPAVSGELSRVVERLLQPEPEKRYRNAKTVLRELKLGHLPALRLSRRALIAGAAAVIVVIATIAYLATGDGTESKVTEIRAETEVVTATDAQSKRGLQLHDNVSVEFNPGPGEYKDYQLVKLSFPAERGKVYFTTDGSDPDKKSELYIDGIVVSDRSTRVRTVFYGFDGTVKETEADYRILREPVEVELDMESPYAWDIYFALKKEWGEPLYDNELARIRALPDIGEAEEEISIIRYLPFIRQEKGAKEYG